MNPRDPKLTEWFGATAPLSEISPAQAVARLREVGDDSTADQLAAATNSLEKATFGSTGFLDGFFNRIAQTTQVCGFLPATGTDAIVPVNQAKADTTLAGQPLKITLDGLHVAKYPGRGTHKLLFDFVLQSQTTGKASRMFHYNARFEAQDGDTVPVRNFPLFYGLMPSAEGITFGFQTINVSSSLNETLLGFLGQDDFKQGLSLVDAFSPVVGQLSLMAANLARWLASQSQNVKVQEFQQGLDFNAGQLSGRLAEGTYIVAQIPKDNEGEWSWADWVVNPTLLRLTQRGNSAQPLEFNHLMFSVHRMGK